MRVSFNRFEQAQQALGSIPLFPIAKWNNKDDEDTAFRSVKLDLKTNPKEAKSAKFSSYFKVFESGSPEQWCRWREDLGTVFKGLNLETGPNQIGMIQHLLAGQARDTFNEFFSEKKREESKENVNLALKKVAATVFADSAVSNQKQYMRHELRKPNKLTARETATRLVQLNTWLSYFPSDGEKSTAEVTKLDDMEIREIYYRLLPMVWRKKIDENINFDRTKEGLKGLVEYAERLETSEARFEGKTRENTSLKDKSPGGNKKPENGQKKGKSETGGANSDRVHSLPAWTRDCLVHGPGCGHPSHKCKILMSHAEKVKGQFKASYKDKTVHKKSSSYKGYNKSKQDRTYTKKEVQMMLQRTNERKKEQEEVEEALEQELNQMEDFSMENEELSDVEDVDAMLNEFHIE
jgi:hypothetical protein